MRAVLPLTADDLPPHIDDLASRAPHAVRRAQGHVRRRADDQLARRTRPAARRVAAAEVTTTGGIVSTRRPGGAAWQAFAGRAPAGDWEMRLPDNAVVRSWFADGLIEDLVLVMTLSGTTPNWP